MSGPASSPRSAHPATASTSTGEKDYNRHHNSIRVVVERAIAHLKTWRILHTDYRRPITTFTTTISAVIGLYFYTAE
nr:transposase family protein [Actinokineospora inagensis]